MTAQRRRRTELQRALSACRSAISKVALFSFAINVLILTPSIYMLQVYDRVLTTGHLETLALLMCLAAGALLLLGALDSLRTAVTVRIGCWLTDRLGPVYLENGVRARLLGDSAGAQPLRDLAQIQTFIATQGLTVFFDAPWVPAFVVLIWLLHPLLGVLALASAVVLLALSVANELATRRAMLEATMAQISANQQAEATIRNAEVVRSMGMLPAVIERWQITNAKSTEAVRRASERGGILVGLTKFIRMFVQIAILGLGALLVLRGELTAGAMVAASILLGRALAPVELAMSAWRNFSSARIAYGRLKARLQAFPAEAERIRLPAPVGHLRVENVTYGPPGSKRPVLQQVSFVVEPGEAVAVIGPSASGKSTLCRLLVGIAAPSEGQVRLDGAELKHWDPNDLGRFVGYLPQDVELFSGSVRENIARLGEPDDNAIVNAARLAHAHDLIQRLPEGYETQIGDSGARLSGGQRQRIGLARAVYGEPRLIVLDEPNANLDQAGEAALAAAVAELKRDGCALVIVGHRPSTLAQADKILLLKDGRVELFGPRDDVLQRLRHAAAGGRPGPVPTQKPTVAAPEAPPSTAAHGGASAMLAWSVESTPRETGA
jgi:ATP-binding cassette subfamily C protein/ATP-binding cassette subfamily C exporter for protease/lipase/ATP-binding cassette subfamily C protein EexD